MYKKIVKVCIYALVFLMPLFWLPLTVEVFEFNKGYLLLLLTAVGLFAWLAQMIFKEKKIKIQSSRFNLFVLGFLVLMIISAVFAKNRFISLFGDYGRFWPSIVGLLSLGGFYFLVGNNVELKRKAKSEKLKATAQSLKLRGNEGQKFHDQTATVDGLLKVFLISVGVVVLMSYLSVFGVWEIVNNKLLSITDNFSLPQMMLAKSFNPTAGSLEGLTMFLAFVVVLLIGLIAFDNDKANKVGKVFKYILLAGCLGILAIIDFWPAWLCLGLSLLLFLGLSFWKRLFKADVNRLSLAVLFLLIAVMFTFSNPLQIFLPQNQVLSSLPAEVLLRQKASWQLGFEGLKGNPILGSGVGNFSYVFSKFKPQSFLQGALWQIRLNRAGNYIVEVFTTTGVLGMLGYLGLLGMFLLMGRRMVLAAKNDKLFIPLLIGFIALLIGQFIYYQNITLAFSFWLMLGLGVVCLNRETSKERVFEFKDFPEVGLVLSIIFWVILAGFCFFGFTITKHYLADAYYYVYLTNPGELAKLEQASQLVDKRGAYHVALARAYLMGFTEEITKDQPDAQNAGNMVGLAVNASRQAVAENPNSVAAQETSGMIYRDIRGVAQGAVEWAITSFKEALALEPNNPGFLTELGKLALLQDDTEAAEAYFIRAIELKPDYVDVHFQLGRFYYNKEEYEKAEQEFLLALQIFPNHSNSLYSLGLIYERRGDREAALQIFERVLELNPGNEDVMAKIDILNNE